MENRKVNKEKDKKDNDKTVPEKGNMKNGESTG